MPSHGPFSLFSSIFLKFYFGFSVTSKGRAYACDDDACRRGRCHPTLQHLVGVSSTVDKETRKSTFLSFSTRRSPNPIREYGCFVEWTEQARPIGPPDASKTMTDDDTHTHGLPTKAENPTIERPAFSHVSAPSSLGTC